MVCQCKMPVCVSSLVRTCVDLRWNYTLNKTVLKFCLWRDMFWWEKVLSLFENAVERVHGGWRMLTEQTFTLDLRHWDVADVRKEHSTSFSPARLAHTILWGTETSAGHDERNRVVLRFCLNRSWHLCWRSFRVSLGWLKVVGVYQRLKVGLVSLVCTCW